MTVSQAAAIHAWLTNTPARPSPYCRCGHTATLHATVDDYEHPCTARECGCDNYQ